MQTEIKNQSQSALLTYSTALLAGALCAYMANDAEMDYGKEMMLVQIQAGNWYGQNYNYSSGHHISDNFNVYLNNGAPDPHNPQFFPGYGNDRHL